MIKPTIEPIWLNLSNEYVIKLEKLLTELPKPFTADMLRKLFDQNGIQVTFPPTSHILYLFCNSWEMDEKYKFALFCNKIKQSGREQRTNKVYAECNDTILERKEEQGTTQYPADADG